MVTREQLLHSLDRALVERDSARKESKLQDHWLKNDLEVAKADSHWWLQKALRAEKIANERLAVAENMTAKYKRWRKLAVRCLIGIIAVSIFAGGAMLWAAIRIGGLQ